MSQQQVPKQEDAPDRGGIPTRSTRQRPRPADQRRRTTANVKDIVHRLDVAVNSIVTAAALLAGMANTSKKAKWARLATDAYELVEQVHDLADDTLLA